MSITKKIDKRNQLFCKEHKNIVMNLALEAIEKEFRDFGALDAMKIVFSLGRAEMEKISDREVSRFYSEDDIGRVCNYYQFVNSAYRTMLEKSKALDFSNQRELESLHNKLKEGKRQELEPLSLSTVMSIEALMEYDKSVIEAKSRQKVEKKSYIGVRDIVKKTDETNERLRKLGEHTGVDLESIYSALEDIRLKINSVERIREEKLRKGQKAFLDIFEDFCDILQAHLEVSSTVGFINMQDVYSIEEIPLVEKKVLGGIFYKIISADKSILPQRSKNIGNAYPMPSLVLAPVTGYVVAATSLAVERFRQNVIIFPMRCLEDPIGGIIRELLKLKKKIDHRREKVAFDAYHSFIRKEKLYGKTYEEMYARFLRFCVGDEVSIKEMDDDERLIIGNHFLKRYTKDIFIPPEIWPIVSQMKVGNDKARLAFNEAIVLFRTDPFTAGTLHADRAKQYYDYIQLNIGKQGDSDRLIDKHKSSMLANLKAAKRLFKKAYKVGANPRFALYNMALLLISIPAEDEKEYCRDLEIAVKLLEKSIVGTNTDLWTYKAEIYIERCCQRLNPTPIELSSDSDEGSDGLTEKTNFVKWLRSKLKM